MLRYILWGAFVLFAASPVLLLSFLKNPEDEKRLEQLRRIVDETPLPPKFKQTYSIESAKTGMADITVSYGVPAYTVSYDEVKKFYARELSARGWTLDQDSQYKRLDGGEVRYLVFRKGEYRISISNANAPPLDYTVSYSWEKP